MATETDRESPLCCCQCPEYDGSCRYHLFCSRADGRGDSSDSRVWGTVPVGNRHREGHRCRARRHNHPWIHWLWIRIDCRNNLLPVNGLLELEGLRRAYGTITALDNLSFGVPAGQVIGFWALRCRQDDHDAGHLRPYRPRRRYRPVEWSPVGHTERRRFGYMPEAGCIRECLGEQVEYLGRLHGLSGASATATPTARSNGSKSPSAGIQR